MPDPRPVHRTILVFDVEGFGDRRTNKDQLAVRKGIYRIVELAFRAVSLDWDGCDREDRGDGIFVLAPPEVAKEQIVDALPSALVDAIDEHNAMHAGLERIRMRMAVHAGEVTYDDHGSTSPAINHTFRLLDAPEAKAALANSSGALVVIASRWFFEEVIQHSGSARLLGYQQITVEVKETTATAWIYLPAQPTGVDPIEIRAMPSRIPGPPRFFTGRAAELAALSEAVRSEAGRRAVRIVAIGGLGGIGKTLLTMHWAHSNRYRFPDGQLYVNLRGYDPSSPPVATEVAVRRLLEGLGALPGSIPVDLGAQIALYRSLVNDKRMLIVLDNARDVEQVEPLLPGGSTCTVIVTSRQTLMRLVTEHGAHPLTLHELDRANSKALLVSRLGRDRIEDEPEAVDQLLNHCAGLPLALSIMAAHAQLHPTFRLTELVEELNKTSDRLGTFDGGELRTNLRAILASSYHTLGHSEATAFRLLGVAPGPDIGLAAVAALIGRPPAQAAAVLRRLENANLVQQYAPGRFRMHDLVRLYARESKIDAPEVEPDALRRLIGFYLHTAYQAERRLYPHRKPIDIGEPPAGFLFSPTADEVSIMDWFESEHLCLLAAQEAAAGLGWHDLSWQLAWAMHGYLWRRGHLHDQLNTWRIGLGAAENLADLPVQALAHRLLGQASARADMHGDATKHLLQAIQLAQMAGDIHGEARAHLDLAGAWGPISDYQALEHASRAVELFIRLENPVWEAEALGAVGWYQARLGRYPAAVESCRRALSLFTDKGNRQGQATTLDCLGSIAYHTGDYALALRQFRNSLALCRDLGATYNEADALDHLGHAHAALNQFADAAHCWQQALELNRAQRRTAVALRLEQQIMDLHVRTGTNGGTH